MSKAIAALGAACLAVGAGLYFWASDTPVVDDLGADGASAEADPDLVTGEIMGEFSNEVLHVNRNVNAFLQAIRRGEGTRDVGGWSRIYGYVPFSGYADHPRKVVTANGFSSSAAGAFQILRGTWDSYRFAAGCNSFDPANQTAFAIYLLSSVRRAYPDIVAGRIRSAMRKCKSEWSSMPFAVTKPKQPKYSENEWLAFYLAEQGELND